MDKNEILLNLYKLKEATIEAMDSLYFNMDPDERININWDYLKSCVMVEYSLAIFEAEYEKYIIHIEPSALPYDYECALPVQISDWLTKHKPELPKFLLTYTWD